ncbi:MAG: S-layer homology domain-containing protein, partial [Clostridia bacterium]|nr:S-layer homology domain-containing protein [Clostridia bacterium]
MKAKRLLSLLLALTLSISLIPNVLAESLTDRFADFPTGWSKPAMEAAVKNGLIYGMDDGLIHPKDTLTRASMAAIIERAFGAKTYADVSMFTDVKEGSWYYDSVRKAYQMRAIYGTSDTTMSPNDEITREQVFTILARVLVLSEEDTSVLNKFNDSAEISSWAKSGMAALVKRGYIAGDENGNVLPKKVITREEFAQLMYMAIRTYITEPGEYTNDLEGITVIRVGDVKLKNLKATSDIVIGDGVLNDSVELTNVQIENRLVARGGKITVKDTTIPGKVVVNNYNGIT